MLFSCQKKEIIKSAPIIEKEYITDPLVYEVIDAVLEMPDFKKDSAEYMLNFANPLLFDFEMDRENFYVYAEEHFGEIDTIEIENQINSSRNSYYQKDKINNIELIDYDVTNIKSDEQLDSLNQSIKKYIPYILISFPIFNKQKNAAFCHIITIVVFCVRTAKSYLLKKLKGNGRLFLFTTKL